MGFLCVTLRNTSTELLLKSNIFGAWEKGKYWLIIAGGIKGRPHGEVFENERKTAEGQWKPAGQSEEEFPRKVMLGERETDFPSHAHRGGDGVGLLACAAWKLDRR
jgi:hypothetical protein